MRRSGTGERCATSAEQPDVVLLHVVGVAGVEPATFRL